MSSLSKVGLGVLLSLLIVLAIESMYIKHQSKIVSKSKQQVLELSTSLDVQNKVSNITDGLVVKAIKANNISQQKKNDILSKVDETTKQVEDEKITSDVADAVYINSMHDAYCTAKPEADSCARKLAR